MCANNRIRFVLTIVFVCLYIIPSHYHHCANLSEDIELIKRLSDKFCSVCEYDKAYFLSYPWYTTWGCVFSVYPFPCDDWEDIYTLSDNHHQIASMNYYPLFRVRSWNNCVRCMSFCILIDIWYSFCIYLHPWDVSFCRRLWVGLIMDDFHIRFVHSFMLWIFPLKPHLVVSRFIISGDNRSNYSTNMDFGIPHCRLLIWLHYFA